MNHSKHVYQEVKIHQNMMIKQSKTPNVSKHQHPKIANYRDKLLLMEK